MIARQIRRIVARFSNIDVKIMDGNKADVADLENISKLPFYQSFRTGLNLTIEGKLEEANQSYQEALNLLTDGKQQLMDHYMHIYKKMIMNNYTLRKPQSVQENLYSLIKIKKQMKVQSSLLYDDYDALLQLYLEFNPEKAIKLGRALLSEREADSLTLKHTKIFQFGLANAYFLVGNYADAKIRYSQCLEGGPNRDLRFKIYNNLALSCWWSKNPLLGEQIISPPAHRVGLIDSDFKQSRTLFLKAIEVSEDSESISDEQIKYQLNQAISQNQLDLGAQFRKQESQTTMYNLAQFYIHNQPNQKVKILFWLRAILKIPTSKESSRKDEVYTTLCLLNNQKTDLQNWVPTMIAKYAKRPQEIYYRKINAFLLGSLGKAGQAKEQISRSSQLEAELLKKDPWAFKRKFLLGRNFAV